MSAHTPPAVQPTARVEACAWADRPAEHPMPLLERRRVTGEKAMVSYLVLHKGCLVPTHAHENEQFLCIIRGRLRCIVGDDRREIILGPDQVLYLPSNTPHSAEALEESIMLDIFTPPIAMMGADRPAR